MPTFAAQLVELRSKFEAEMQAVIDDARKREASLEQTIGDLERLAAQQDQRMAHKPVDKVESFKKQLQKQRLLRDVDAEYMRVNSNDLGDNQCMRHVCRHVWRVWEYRGLS